MFVLDSSVAMRWLMKSQNRQDQRYAENVLRSMKDSDAVVPAIWHLEAANVLITAQRAGKAAIGQTESFFAQLENLPLSIDPQTYAQSFGRTMSLARAFGLTSYDAAYLELAVRKSAELATLDRPLMKAAKKAGVGIYLKN